MKIADYLGFEIHVPTSGGKAGTGRNRTSTIQLRRANCIQKQFSFVMDDPDSRSRAIAKAKHFAESQAKQ